MKVIKRDGRLQELDLEKIKISILSATNESKELLNESDVKILELADRVQNIENQKQKLLRKMDRSRRATNSNNYNEFIKHKNNQLPLIHIVFP